jgi:hypothetical protein
MTEAEPLADLDQALAAVADVLVRLSPLRWNIFVNVSAGATRNISTISEID